MAEQTKEKPNFYALLIGIDGYQSNQMYKNLKGCVRDINLVADYLQKTLPEIFNLKVSKLTSPNFDVLDVPSTEEPRPTYKNIVEAFRSITETAQPKEQVYIHYSGHGGHATTIYPDLKGEGQYDEAIVPMDIGEAGRYLRDVELATLLKRMTDKGLVVTVVFDSCHSGGATRGDSDIRGNEKPDTAKRPEDSLVDARQALVNNWRTLTEGTSSGVAPGGWLTQSRGYVLLAACRPSEYAFEYAVNGNERHGALTYWMIDTLTSSTTGLTYKSLHDRVNAKIQSKFPSQLPMLLGEGDRSVFGSDRVSTQYAVTVMKVDEDQLTLNAGLAQGLSRGTRFAIYPLNTADLSNKQQQLAIIEITEVKASSSLAKVLGTDEGGIAVKAHIEQGAPAVMVSAPIDLVRRVRLFDQKQVGERENELPPELVGKQKEALETIRQALAGNGWVVELQPDDKQEAYYQVAIALDGEYEICIGMPINNLRPALKIDDSNAAKGVVNRLVQLAKYQTVQELDNSASELTTYLEFELCDQDKKPFPNSSNLTLNKGKVVYLRVKNTFSQPLNIAVLDLEPTWAISQMPIEGIQAPFYQLDSQKELFIGRFRLGLPEGEEYQQATETLKLFATRGLADFRWLTLTALDQEFEKKGSLDGELERKAEELTTRGGAHSISPLNNLLATIGADVDNPPTITRAMMYEPDPNAEWVTKEIKITVKQS